MAAKTIQYQYAKEPYYVFGIATNSPLAISADNEMIAYADTDYNINITDGNGNKILTIRTDTGNVNDICFAYNDELLVTGVEEGLFVYQIKTKKLLFHLEHCKEMQDVHEGPVTALLSFGTTLVSGGADTDIHVWYIGLTDQNLHQQVQQRDSVSVQMDNYQLTLLSSCNAHKTRVTRIVKSPTTNQIASLSQDNSTKVWVLEENFLPPKEVGFLSIHRSDVLCACFSQSGKLLATGSRDNAIAIFDAKTSTPLKVFNALNSDVEFLQFCNNDQFLLAGGFSGEFVLFKMESFESELETKADGVESALVIPEVQKLIKSTDKNEPPLEKIAEFKLQTICMHTAVFATKKPLLVTAQQAHLIRYWSIENLTSPVLKKEVYCFVETVTAIEQFDGPVFGACSKDGSFAILDYQRGDKHVSVQTDSSLNDICYNGEFEQIFVATSKYEIIGYQIVQNGQPPREFCRFIGHKGSITKLLCIGDVIVSASMDTSIMTWKIPDVKEDVVEVKYAQKFNFAPGNIQEMRFSESLLLFSATNHSLFIARVTGTNIKLMQEIKSAHAASIVGLGYDGQQIYSCSVDGSIKTWLLNPPKNKDFNSGKGVVRSGGSDSERFDRFSKCSSVKPNNVLIMPKKLGLPNCMHVNNGKIVIGTTSGEIYNLSPALQPLECYYNEGLETISSVCAIGDKYIAGLRKGSIEIWDKSCICETKSHDFVFDALE